jgi:hypothetical protein
MTRARAAIKKMDKAGSGGVSSFYSAVSAVVTSTLVLPLGATLFFPGGWVTGGVSREKYVGQHKGLPM